MIEFCPHCGYSVYSAEICLIEDCPLQLPEWIRAQIFNEEEWQHSLNNPIAGS